MTAKLVPNFDSSVWVDAHGDYLYKMAYSRVRDSVTAERLLIETFTDAARLPFENTDRDAERKWLAELLKAKIRDSIRQSCGNGKVPADETDFSSFEYLFDDRIWKQHWTPALIPTQWQITPETAAGEKGFFETLTNCISELPRHAAAAFTLRELDGLKRKEICEFLNIDAEVYEALLNRARMHLRRCLEIRWYKRRITEDH